MAASIHQIPASAETNSPPTKPHSQPSRKSGDLRQITRGSPLASSSANNSWARFVVSAWTSGLPDSVRREPPEVHPSGMGKARYQGRPHKSLGPAIPKPISGTISLAAEATQPCEQLHSPRQSRSRRPTSRISTGRGCSMKLEQNTCGGQRS